MKVLALVASRRKLGNSEILAKEMLSALPDTVEKEMIRLTDLDIKDCEACYACLAEEGKCVIQDDLHFFLNKVQEADGIIICSPCYFLGEHTVLKKIGDRMLSVLKKGQDFSAKKCVIAVCYGVEGWEGYAIEAVHNFASFLYLQVKGKLLVRAANPGEVATPAILQKARDLAQCLLENRSFYQEGEFFTCSVCNSSLLQLSKDGMVRCPMCGKTGNLRKKESNYVIAFQEQGWNRFSEEALIEHAGKLDQIKEKYIAKRRELKKIRERYAAYDWWVFPNRNKS